MLVGHQTLPHKLWFIPCLSSLSKDIVVHWNHAFPNKYTIDLLVAVKSIELMCSNLREGQSLIV